MSKQSKFAPLLPGTHAESDINRIYERLLAGNTITSLDAVFKNNTICLTKYISILRNKYRIPIKDRWVKVSKRKHVKEYWIE